MPYIIKFGAPLNQQCEADSCTLSPTPQVHSNTSHGRSFITSLQFTKKIDHFSATLFRHMTTATVFPRVLIEVRGEKGAPSGMTYACGDVDISSFSSQRSVDLVGLEFGSIHVVPN